MIDWLILNVKNASSLHGCMYVLLDVAVFSMSDWNCFRLSYDFSVSSIILNLPLLYDRMAMRCSSVSRGPPSWRSWWTPIVTASLWTWMPLHSFLMAAGFAVSRPQMRWVCLQTHSTCRNSITLRWIRDWHFVSAPKIVSAGDGGRRWDWCHASPDRRLHA